ncbi:MAG: response regulator transcription factor [Acidimicrobiales bacterium]
MIADIHGGPRSVSRHPVILVIDGDLSSRQSLAAMLSIEGFEVITASTSGDGIDSLISVSPDLVLLDPGWGGDDGLQLVESIVTISSVPVIVVTSGAAEGLNPVLTIERGAADHLVSPLRQREVVARILAVLRRVGCADRGSGTVHTGKERGLTSGWPYPAGPDRIA